MLDDKNYVQNLDPDDALGLAVEQAAFLQHSFKELDLRLPDNVVFCGMGGSALAAVLAKSWLADSLTAPFDIVRHYDIPAFVGENTLLVCASYSGNTEETISCFNQAVERGSQIVVISHGGQLQELAEANNAAHVMLPDVSQPRFATLAALKALATVLDAAGITDTAAVKLEQSHAHVEKTVRALAANVNQDNNPAKRIAHELVGTSVEVFGGPLLDAAAYKWKISFNENAKNTAFYAPWPEFSHNEFIGWSQQPQFKPFSIVQLVSKCERERIKQRYDISNRLLSGKMPEPHQITMTGSNETEDLLEAVVYGDFVSLYLAILNGVNPTPVDLVEKLKNELKKLDD